MRHTVYTVIPDHDIGIGSVTFADFKGIPDRIDLCVCLQHVVLFDNDILNTVKIDCGCGIFPEECAARNIVRLVTLATRVNEGVTRYVDILRSLNKNRRVIRIDKNIVYNLKPLMGIPDRRIFGNLGRDAKRRHARPESCRNP